MATNKNWKNEPLSIEQWKENCQKSEHVREGDVLTFPEGSVAGVVRCFIEGTSVFLGAYFLKEPLRNGDGIKAGIGWNH